MNRIRSIAFLVLDLACAVVFVCGLIAYGQVGKPYKRGFFCNDEDIQKPYKKSTITTVTGMTVGFALVFVVVLGTELLLNHLRRTCRVRNDPDSNSGGSHSSKIPPVILSILWVLCTCLFGLAMNQFLTDVGKYSIGRLRPHSLDVCKPNWSRFNCTDERGNYIFIVDDVCTVGEGTKKGKDMRLSFPSGFSSFSAYLMVFLALYIEAKLLLPKKSKFLKPFMQAVLLLVALYTGLSRVSDYSHYWSDVLAGFFLGTSIAFLTIFRILKPGFGREYQEVNIEQMGIPETEHVLSSNPQVKDEA